MGKYHGKFNKKQEQRKGLPVWLIFLSFLLIEVFAFFFLSLEGEFATAQLWPLAFGFFWAVILSGVIRCLPNQTARIIFGLVYFFVAVYAGFQTGYYILFAQMMWLSDFRYASEGADYADVLLTYPEEWWMGILGMIVLGVLLIWKFPVWAGGWKRKILNSLESI